MHLVAQLYDDGTIEESEREWVCLFVRMHDCLCMSEGEGKNRARKQELWHTSASQVQTQRHPVQSQHSLQASAQ